MGNFTASAVGGDGRIVQLLAMGFGPSEKAFLQVLFRNNVAQERWEKILEYFTIQRFKAKPSV